MKEINIDGNVFTLLEPNELMQRSTPPPPFLQQLGTAATAATRFISQGAPVTPPTDLATRESTCRACPEWDAAAINGTGRCRKCGCSTWAKLRMATERCPLGKWEAVNFEGSLESGSEQSVLESAS